NAVRDRSESLSGLNRNRCPQSSEPGGMPGTRIIRQRSGISRLAALPSALSFPASDSLFGLAKRRYELLWLPKYPGCDEPKRSAPPRRNKELAANQTFKTAVLDRPLIHRGKHMGSSQGPPARPRAHAWRRPVGPFPGGRAADHPEADQD